MRVRTEPGELAFDYRSTVAEPHHPTRRLRIVEVPPEDASCTSNNVQTRSDGSRRRPDIAPGRPALVADPRRGADRPGGNGDTVP